MTAPRFICRNTKKALAERGPSIHDGEIVYAARFAATMPHSAITAIRSEINTL
jgi:hypothetical protein